MEKDNRRDHFEKKQHHQQKEKNERARKEELSSNITESLNVHSIQDLEIFIEQKYEGIAEKVPDSLPTVNKTILRKLKDFRDAWINSQKEQYMTFLMENGIQKGEEIYTVITEG